MLNVVAQIFFSGENQDNFAEEKAALLFGNWNEDGMSLTFYCLSDGILAEKQVQDTCRSLVLQKNKYYCIKSSATHC